MRHLLLTFLLLPLNALANNFDTNINNALTTHFNQYKEKEYFSGIAVAVYKPNLPIANYYIGYTGHEKNSPKIKADTLFQIGSITKSFTAAIALQLMKENKLQLKDTLQQWLPQYQKWSTLTIESLLNMTSGLPNYSDAPVLNALQFQHPHQNHSAADLIKYVYPAGTLSPPLKSGYFYTNTGYILSGMIIEKITKHDLGFEIQNRLLKPLQLNNTFYPLPTTDHAVAARLANGYGFNPYMNPELVGKEVSSDNLSWAGAAGAILSNMEDVVRWVKAIFVDDTILDKQQKEKMMSVVSIQSGEPISQVSTSDPRAFGLGIIQGYDKDMGKFWFYEGETEGFRTLYLYVPSSGIIIAAAFNSAVNSENDHANELMKAIYKLTR